MELACAMVVLQQRLEELPVELSAALVDPSRQFVLRRFVDECHCLHMVEVPGGESSEVCRRCSSVPSVASVLSHRCSSVPLVLSA